MQALCRKIQSTGPAQVPVVWALAYVTCVPGERCVAFWDARVANCDNDRPGVGAGINPDANEVVADGVDQNCDGTDDCYLDIDGDGHAGDVIGTDTDADAEIRVLIPDLLTWGV